ncbi:MAG: DUF547 domain-containing protein [Proteobacteria bacterium]|nr:DUF547 domain-containing protein [Pseudomonadota bacterium]
MRLRLPRLAVGAGGGRRFRTARELSVLRGLTLWLALAAVAVPAAAFDQTHHAWNALLSQHVVLVEGGNASRVDYTGMLSEKPALDAYMAALSAVAPTEFATWSKAEQEAFLINAYNAFTVELILTRYPHLQSIKELGGSWLTTTWKRDFFVLLGRQSSLDDVEAQLRAPGVYDDPRIHFAINCASIGCPMLRNEAYVAGSLQEQLEDAVRRFLSDQSRNRYDPRSGTLEVSKIFDWYAGDFASGNQGFHSVEQFLGRHADSLASDPRARDRIRAGGVKLTFLPYDWSLNAKSR